jgi:hypothetical protein
MVAVVADHGPHEDPPEAVVEEEQEVAVGAVIAVEAKAEAMSVAIESAINNIAIIESPGTD